MSVHLQVDWLEQLTVGQVHLVNENLGKLNSMHKVSLFLQLICFEPKREEPD